MPTLLRSKGGCWTCRLRRKKCDERQPICVTCESLSITCHGYGKKPDFMDGGEREIEVRNKFKGMVKASSRRKMAGGSRWGGIGTKILAPRNNQSEGSENAARLSHDEATQLNEAPSETLPGSDIDKSKSNIASWEPPIVSSSQAALLMHFLDQVFPLQYPMYKPSVAEGGRGWIISLLLRSKPLYHASMALAAYHRRAILLAQHRNASGCVQVEQEKHLALCLEDFRKAIGPVLDSVAFTCPTDTLGLMACIVQLIFFELFAGDGDTWKIHLRAATPLFKKAYIDTVLCREIIDSGEKAELPDIVGQEDRAIFRFLGGALFWLDILSSITTGKAPDLQEIHSHALKEDSKIQLENIMGCQNWAMLQISRVAALYEFKMQGLQHDNLNTTEFAQMVNDIIEELQRGVTEETLVSLELSSSQFSKTNIPVGTPQRSITRIFALAASIYLHIVVNGLYPEAEPESEYLKVMVDEAMVALRTQMSADLIHTIVCPLYLIGCAAGKEDEGFFRYAFSTEPILEPSLDHRKKILPILEEIWRMRRVVGSRLDWEDLLKLTGGRLLLE